MKLNKAGMELFNKWRDVYYAELGKIREEKNDQEWIDGWCIIDNTEFVHGVEDEVGLLVFGYGENLPNYFAEQREYGTDYCREFYTDAAGNVYSLDDVESVAQKYFSI